VDGIDSGLCQLAVMLIVEVAVPVFFLFIKPGWYSFFFPWAKNILPVGPKGQETLHSIIFEY
jgi:hypothetical protein